MQCPTCGKELTNERGMRQHHTKVHDEPLPNRTCNGCGVEFYDPKARLEYCENCNPNAGERNGNWKGAKETGVCEACGGSFEYYPSDKQGVYCPECVTDADEFLGTPYYDVHDIETLEKECEFCGEEMSVLKSQAAYGRGRFSSRECLSEWMSENRKGKNAPAWKGGRTKYRGKWMQARREARDRDEHTCQVCGTTASELGREPDTHHIKPIKEFADPLDAHFPKNLVCLCPECHRHVETGNLQLPVEFRPDKE